MIMRYLGFCLLVVAMQPAPDFAQQQNSTQRGISSYDLWLVRSQTITGDLIKDSADLSNSERAVLWARLGAKWWRDDPEKARSWMLKGIEIVESVPNKENPAEQRERLTTTRRLLQIVAPLDEKLNVRLVALLKQDAEAEPPTERAANADALIQTAILLVELDPKRAAELGMLALRIGPPTDMTRLLWKLRENDLKLADVLFGQALAKAREAPDGSFLFSLVTSVFPEHFTEGFTPARPVATDAMRRDILTAYVGQLQANRSDAEIRDYPCMRVISIAPLVPEFDRLLPEQGIILRQSISQCQSLHPLARQRVDDAVREQPLNTVDDLLKAGDDAEDMKVRTVYQFRAASLASQQSDYDWALKILDQMSSESREFMSGAWVNIRWDWAATSALRHLKKGDVQGMRLIIDAVPKDLQAYAKIAFIDRLPTDRDRDTDPTLEFLSEARRGLGRPSLSNEDPSWYFALLKLTVKHQPSEATAVLKEAVAAINRADDAEAKKDNRDNRNWFDGSEVLSAPLFEIDEYAVREAISTISSANTRVQIRLELLRVCLDRMRTSKPNAPRQRRAG
jgi:hypothetical protein